jgi:CRISPR system Cascade subunit CasC
MNLEVHILQNFAPSNLNRDESGSPKDCEFGGYRRARISSQCLKRAIRNSFRDEDLVPPEQRAVRTKWLIGEVADRLVQAGHDAALARLAVEVALGSIGLTTDGKDARKTQYLLFLGADEIERITRICAEHWDALATGTGDGRRDKKAAKGAMPKEVRPRSRRTTKTSEGRFWAAMLFCLPVGMASTEAWRKARTVSRASSSSSPRFAWSCLRLTLA